MKSETWTIQQVFQDRRQYKVPFYQRPYVWTFKDQWEILWADIADKAAERLAGATPPPHFLGAIVVEPQDRIALRGVDNLAWPKARHVHFEGEALDGLKSFPAKPACDPFHRTTSNNEALRSWNRSSPPENLLTFNPMRLDAEPGHRWLRDTVRRVPRRARRQAVLRPGAGLSLAARPPLTAGDR